MTVLAAAAIDATLIVGLGLLACLVFRRRSAAFRHVLIASAITAAGLAPVFELVVPQLMVVERTVAEPPPATSIVPTPPATPHADTVVAATAASPKIPWTALLAFGWAAGVLVMLVTLGLSLGRLFDLIRGCTPVRDGLWQTTADRLALTHGLRRPVRILISAHRAPLVTFGFWRPRIILPVDAAEWSDDRRRVVLTHELAHIRRHDVAVQLAAELVRAVHWFNPLVWVACRRLRQESEYACDDSVLETGIEPADYATHLLEVAKHAAGYHRAWGPAPAVAHPSTLERRISAMLNQRRNRETVTRHTRSWVVAAVAMASVSLVAADIVTTPLPVGASAAASVVLPERLDVARTVDNVAPSPVPAAASAPAVRSRAVKKAPAFSGPTQAATAPAIQARGAMTGAVVDQSGGSIPGATLTLTARMIPSNAGTIYRTLSGADGRFAFRDLEPGQYTLVASSPGFMRITSDVTTGAEATADRVVTLPLGTLEETVAVACSAARAERTKPAERRQASALVARFEPPGWVVGGWRRVAQAVMPVVSAEQQDRRPIRIGGDVRVPRKATHVLPVCPATAIPGTEVRVRLVARIGADGTLRDVTSLAAPPDAVPSGALIDAALAAVRQWTYTPAALNGRPIEVQLAVSVIFHPR